MKKRNLFALAAATMLFAACSDDLPNGEGGNGLEGDAWLSLSIAPSMGTRAYNTDNPHENGTVEETKVNGIRVVLFDESRMVLSATDAVSFQSESWGDKGTTLDGTNTTDAFKVPKASKYLLVILNPSSTLPTATVGMTYDQYNAAISTSVEKVISQEKTPGTVTIDNFMMSNARGDLEPGTGTLTTYPTAEKAEENAFELNVDRVVAKVRVYTASAIADNSTGFTLGTTYNWKLNVTNKQFFPVSKRTKTNLATNTWADATYKLGSYRIDPNYDNSKNVYKPGGTTTENAAYIKNYNYFTTPPADKDWNAITTANDPSAEQGEGNAKDPAEYCLENTQNKAGNYHAYTTHVILKAKVVPTTFRLPSDKGDSGSVDSDDTDNYSDNWFKVGSGFYTKATLVEYIKAELVYKASNDSYVTTITNLVNAYLDDAATKALFSTIKKVDISSLSAENAATLAAAFGTELAKVTASNSAQSVSYYHGGINYYKIMVKHDNDTNNTNNELGEFGVVRNSVYDIHINSINNPGYPVIPEPDPNTPDEEGDYYLSVKININPWTWYTQTENL